MKASSFFLSVVLALFACSLLLPKTAHSQRQLVYCALYDENNIGIVDPVAGKLVQRIQVGRNPDQVLLNSDRSKLYVSNTGEFTVSIVSIAENKVSQVLRLPVNRRNIYSGVMARTPDGMKIFVAERAEGDEDLRIYVVDTQKELIIGQFDAGKHIVSVAVSNDGKKLFVVNKGESIRVFDTDTYQATGTVELVKGCEADLTAIGTSPIAPKACVSYGKMNKAQLFNTDNLKTESVLDMPKYKTGIQGDVNFNPDGKYAFIFNSKTTLKEVDGVNVLDVAKNEFIKIFNSGVVDRGIATADDNNICYIAAQDLLKWYALSRLEHLKSISLRTQIHGIAVVPK
jgi:DNA-binding beta-propeller fold protein YncE